MQVGKFVICTGPMFSGKTEELIRLSNRYVIAGKNIKKFKPKVDTRYGTDAICTHDSRATSAIEIINLDDILPVISNSAVKIDAIFVDELQFIKNVSIEVIRIITETHGINLYASGLILDSFRNPFPEILKVYPYAEIIQLQSVCNFCGSFDAIYTYRLTSKSNEQVCIGGSGDYCAICACCLKDKNEKDK